MKKLLAFLTLLTLPVGATELSDRVRIPEFRRDTGKPIYVASLAPLASMPVLFQIIPGGGGGTADPLTLTSSLTVGTTTTAGTATCVIKGSISGGSATDNWLNCTATTPTTLTAITNALNLQITGAGSSSFTSRALNIDHLAGYTGSSDVFGLAVTEANATTGTAVGLSSTVSAGTKQVAGYFGFAPIAAGHATAALVINNGAVAGNILCAEDNGTCVFTISDGGAITTTAGQTHTLNGNISIPAAAGNNAALFFGSFGSSLRINTTLTPDGLTWGLPSTSNSLTLMEEGDANFDFQNFCTTGLGTAACTDPTVIIHSHNQDTGEALALAHDGKAGVIVGGNSTVLDGTLRLGGTVTLAEGSATTVLTVPVAVSTGTGGIIHYTVEARDATNTQIRVGNVNYAVANNSSGTETCNVFGIGPTTQAAGGNTTNPANPTEVQDGSGTGAITSGTLTYTWSVDTSGTNQCALKLNATSSLTQTTFQIHYTVIQSGPGVSTGG